MPLFGRKKSEPKEKKQAEEHIICPHCFTDFTVSRVQEAGGVCPSCKGKIDLDKIPRARL
jgi:ribosomal protein L37AE/L43A